MKPYKGYTASITFDDEAFVFFGEVIGIRDVITFEASTAAELEQAFRDSVDDYLAWAREDGFAPEKPYSGKLAFRTTPEHHRIIAAAAARKAQSINQWMDETLAKAARETLEDGRTSVKIT